MQSELCSEKIHSARKFTLNSKNSLYGFNWFKFSVKDFLWEEDNGRILQFVGKLRLCIPDQT
jgi:hypothetical protein